MRRNLLAVTALVLSITAVACGKDAPSPASETAADPARARRLLLVADDFPAGWTSTPPSPETAEDDAQSKALAECAGAVDPGVAESASAESPDFEKGSASVASDVTYVKTVAYARQDLAALTGSKFKGCAERFARDLLEKQLAESGATLDSLTFDRITVPKYGDATEAYRMTARVTVQGQTLPLYVDLVFILKGRAEISVSFFEVGKPFDQGLQRDLLAKMGAKLSAA